MAGLLDFLNTDQGRMGLGLLAAAGPRTDGAGFGQRLQEGMGSFDAYKQNQLKTKHAEMQMQEFAQGVTQKQQAAAEQARIRGIVSQGGTDWQGMIRAGVPVELVKQLAESQNFGRSKVARTAEVEGPNGQKMVQSFDDYGQQVGQGVNGYVAPQLIDLGNAKTFAKPMLGASFPVGMSPESAASNALGWANNAATRRGQDMTDARARDLNSIKLSEKKSVEDLTKGGQIASFDTMLSTLDRLSKHPGLARSVGVVGAFPTMPGSESANFKAELDTFQSQAFLPMVSQLKGMGALSDAEGKKLTAAVGALNPAMGEKAFRESIGRITTEMDAARARVSGQPTPKQDGGASGNWDKPPVPMKGMVQGGYKFKGGDPSNQANWEKQ